ncbi:MAG: polyhydroxyalkanoate synthesis regulator DNA-binding domain-containing protein [Bdellovibrionia bacterium]
MQDVIKIKKYGNRRYYSSHNKTYINLQDIESYIQNGKSVFVTDADSEEDITSEVLLQILVQQGRAHHLPTPILETMIRMNEKALIKFWAPLLESNFKMLFQMNEIMSKNMQNLMGSLKKKSNNSK